MSQLPAHMHRGACILFLRRLFAGLSKLSMAQEEGWDFLVASAVYMKACEG